MKLTLLLILINVLVFFYSLTNPDYFFTNYGFSVNNLLSGRYYTIITSMFLHAGLWHLAANMIALLLLGTAVESKIKSWPYLLVYFLGGIFGNLLMYPLTLVPFFGYTVDTIAVGASAAISALIGLGTFVCPGKLTMFPIIIPIPFIVVGAIYFVSTLSNLLMPSEIAYPAHLAGLATGAVFGLIWGENRIKRMLLFIFIVLLIIALPYALPAIIRAVVK